MIVLKHPLVSKAVLPVLSFLLLFQLGEESEFEG